MDSMLVDAISRALHDAFGDGYTLYGDEEVKQGMQRPCFFIAPVTSEQTQLLGDRFARAYAYMLHYIPQKDGDYRELRGVTEGLYGALEYITLRDGDLVRAVSMEYQVADGVLHFSVRYNLLMLKKREQTPMDALEVAVGTTGRE